MGSVVVGTASAALIDRGNGLIYDSDQDITWLQEASGIMNWYAAQEWIAAMNAANYKGYNNWRLPYTVNNPLLQGVNITSSEMGYMYYVNLGNVADQGNNPGPFSGFMNHVFWSNALDNNWAWVFHFDRSGYQQLRRSDYYGMNVWAVRDGDVVPEPSSLLVLLTGAAGLCGFALRRQK